MLLRLSRDFHNDMVTTTCQPLNLCKHTNPGKILFVFSQSVGSSLTPKLECYMGLISGNIETEDSLRWSLLSWLENHLNNRLIQRIFCSLVSVEAQVEKSNSYSFLAKKDNSHSTVVKTHDTSKIILSPNF